ncbi:hypothetical protein BHQ19_31425 [Mycolicibacterium porcinum]|nr:hypothetical protein BHQ19_31425 [Mycolicibacterium porcinum]
MSEMDPATGHFAVDVVLHEPSGPASKWARAAKPGDSIPADWLATTQMNQVPLARSSTGRASNPVRDAALVGLSAEGVKVRSNRGVAGIDGTVSTAIGAALAHDRAGGGDGTRRTIALIGDLTFVHDSSGLLIGPTEPTPRNLTIVVSNDNGGGIFELLEQGDPRFADVSSRIFGTPHDVDVAALCRAYHVDSRQLEIGDLAAALAEPFEGMRVLEVKADRSSLRALHASIKAAL